jgi:multicomponent K+:H+ antiporter subunit D
MSHWIIAPVALPALIAAILILARRQDITLHRALSVAASVGLLAVAMALVHAATVAPPEAYHLGNWPAPFGIVLMLDRLSAMMVLLTSVLALFVLIYAIGADWDRKGRHFHALFQFQLMGICGAFLTADAFNLFVFFEVLLIASYGLMLHGGGRDRVRAGFQYVAFNLIGSTLFLFALATVYSVTGTLNMADLAVKLPTLPAGDMALIRVAAVMLLLVFAIKGALVPLHFWLPGTYANAPGVVAALFAVMTKIGAYAVLRFGTLVFPPDLPATDGLYADILLPAALVTLGVGAIGVLGARSLPRLAAFAAIASMGTVFVAIAGFTPATTSAALYYIVHSTLAGAALFLVADMVLQRRGDAALHAGPPGALGGLVSALYLAAAIGSAGMPPLSGFIGKLLVLSAWAEDAAFVWTVILVATFLMILGFARAGTTLFWKPEPNMPALPAPVSGPMAQAAVMILIGLMAALTVLGGPVTAWLDATASGLYDPAAYIDANRLYEEP